MILPGKFLTSHIFRFTALPKRVLSHASSSLEGTMEPQLLTPCWCSSYANCRSASNQLDSKVQLHQWNLCSRILYISRDSSSFWKWSFELWTIQQPSNQQGGLPTYNFHQLWEETSAVLCPMGWNQYKDFPRPFLLKLCSLFSKKNRYRQITALYQHLCCFFSPFHLLQPSKSYDDPHVILKIIPQKNARIRPE